MIGSPQTTPLFQADRQTLLIGAVLLVTGAGLLTANDALIKLAINNHALGQVMLIRSVFSMVTVLVCLPLLGGWQNLRINNGRGVTLCAGLLIISVMEFRYSEAAVLSTLKYSAILFALLYGYGLWGDVPDLLALVGAVCIILSGIAIIRFRRTPG